MISSVAVTTAQAPLELCRRRVNGLIDSAVEPGDVERLRAVLHSLDSAYALLEILRPKPQEAEGPVTPAEIARRGFRGDEIRPWASDLGDVIRYDAAIEDKIQSSNPFRSER